MKIKSTICTVFLTAFWIGGVLFLNGCKPDPVAPTLTTTAASSITINSASTGGNITSNGGADITARGVCWALTTQPLVSGSHTSDSQGDGSFISNLTGLTPGTKYYVRAYAENKAGTSYGNEVSFMTTSLAVPVLTTIEATGITSNSAVSGGNITSDGGASVSSRGVCWAVSANPTIDDSNTANGTGTGSFVSNLNGLLPGTTYYARAYATNGVGTAYGNDITFTTTQVAPTLTTTPATNITYNSAVSGGNITSTGGAPIDDKGVCWSITTGPVATGSHASSGAGSGTYTSNITGLNPGITYYIRAYAKNSAGTSYGNQLNFTTNSVTAPTLTTNSVSGITMTSAVSGGNITSENGDPVSERGVCWNTTGSPTTSNPKTTDGIGMGSFISHMDGLLAGTTYYVRAYATNTGGTAYGNEISFTTVHEKGTVTDLDGNVYVTVKIGTQWWMQSDLKTTRYNDNSSILNITDDTEWSSTTSPAYCWYNNNPSYGDTYGILYNWYAVGTGDLCPTGWHVPSDPEFKTLELYLGVPLADISVWGWRGTDQGSQMKSTSGWNNSGNGTNSSEFTALPGGYRYGLSGTFNAIGILTYWWSSSQDGTSAAWYRRLDGANSDIYYASTSLKGGKFVRCIKN